MVMAKQILRIQRRREIHPDRRQLRVVADGQSVVVRGDDGTFDPLTGQRVLDFEVSALRDDVVRVLRAGEPAPEQRRAAYAQYLEGCRLDEEELTFDRAEAAYRRALELDPTLANALTNLGNLRFRRGGKLGVPRYAGLSMAMALPTPSLSSSSSKAARRSGLER